MLQGNSTFGEIYFALFVVDHCTGYLCRSNGRCISKDKVCNNIADCPEQDDELYCHFCPPWCTCVNSTYTCSNRNFTNVTFIPKDARIIDLSNNSLFVNENNLSFNGYLYLRYLNLSHNGLNNIDSIDFKDLSNLQILDISFNNWCKVLRKRHLSNLNNLQTFILSNNEISNIESGAFSSMNSLQILILSNNSLYELSKNMFIGLMNLKILDLSSNLIIKVERETFSNISHLDIIDIRANALSQVMIDDLSSLKAIRLYSSVPQLCCLAGVHIQHCELHVSVCMCMDILPTPIWNQMLLGVSLLTITVNMAVLLDNVLCKKARSKTLDPGNIPLFFITISYIHTGIYMIILAGSDISRRNTFMSDLRSWKESGTCQVAGFVGLFSFHISNFGILLFLVDHLVIIKKKDIKPRRRKEYLFVIIALILMFISCVCGLPISIFSPDFYGRSHICIPFFTINPHNYYLFMYDIFLHTVTGLTLLLTLIFFIICLFHTCRHHDLIISVVPCCPVSPTFSDGMITLVVISQIFRCVIITGIGKCVFVNIIFITTNRVTTRQEAIGPRPISTPEDSTI